MAAHRAPPAPGCAARRPLRRAAVGVQVGLHRRVVAVARPERRHEGGREAALRGADGAPAHRAPAAADALLEARTFTTRLRGATVPFTDTRRPRAPVLGGLVKATRGRRRSSSRGDDAARTSALPGKRTRTYIRFDGPQVARERAVRAGHEPPRGAPRVVAVHLHLDRLARERGAVGPRERPGHGHVLAVVGRVVGERRAHARREVVANGVPDAHQRADLVELVVQAVAGAGGLAEVAVAEHAVDGDLRPGRVAALGPARRS